MRLSVLAFVIAIPIGADEVSISPLTEAQRFEIVFTQREYVRAQVRVNSLGSALRGKIAEAVTACGSKDMVFDEESVLCKAK